jgi:hypothetical protein
VRRKVFTWRCFELASTLQQELKIKFSAKDMASLMKAKRD